MGNQAAFVLEGERVGLEQLTRRLIRKNWQLRAIGITQAVNSAFAPSVH